jgi:hypothetical protein
MTMTLTQSTRRRLVLAAIALGLVAVAGCLGSEDAGPADSDELPGDADGKADAMAAMTAHGGDHDHANPAQHNVSYNAKLLDHLPFVEEGASGSHALALAGDTLFVGSTLQGDNGFYAVDVSDPAHMEVVGEWHDERAVGGDRSIAASEEGDWVVLGTEGDTEAEEAGVRLFDTSDASDPQQVDFMPLDGGAHTVDIKAFDGSTYVFALNYGVQIMEIVDGPEGPQLVKVGHYGYAGPEMTDSPDYENPANYPSWGLRSAYAHDMKPIVDEEAGPLLYVAYAYQGLHVLDVSQPSAPELVSRWTPSGEASPWYTHTVDADWIDGERVIVVGSEVFEDRHNETPSPVWILDGSDLQDPTLESTWTNPAGVGSQNLLFSAHFFRIDEGRLHLSHYHAGSWVLDISSAEKQADPVVESAYLPNADTGHRPGTECCFGWNLAGIPVTMDTVGKGEVTFAADVQTGLYAIENTAK